MPITLNHAGDILRCVDCGAAIEPGGAAGGAACGWEDREYKRAVCYACCAARDVAHMTEHGRFTLYAVRDGGAVFVVNWPGTLRFAARLRRTWTHRTPGVLRPVPCALYDFTGPDGRPWTARTCGELSTLARCRRLKRTPRRVR